ncbi:TPA: hypothetical protein ACH3X2_011104 [Trebouxia sp. C0005]
MVASTDEPGSPDRRSGRDSDSSIDTLLASALQRNMSFTEDRKRQHTPGTANRPRQLRKGVEMEFDADQKENNDPVALSTKKVTPSRLACIKQLEQEMTCSVCLDICVRPCTTPCGAPICINTVLWNTIKLLFPKHAASAPDSPADAIFTPASVNRAAVVANAVADLPVRRGLARVPFIPPRISRPELPQPAAPQRAPPSWLEGATRDSDPPASARRHRLASSSQQQTLSQAIDRWNGPAAGPGANAANGSGVFLQQPVSPVGEPAHARGATRRGRWTARVGGNQLQRANSAAHGLRGPMPSMLDNLQRRLDDLPIPDVLHRSNSSQSQEPAAGLEASPSLRVRPFPNPPQARQPQPPAPDSFSGVQATQPAHAQPVRPQVAAWQPPRMSRPTWNTHAEPPAVRQGMHASEDWLLDLPDTPEAPRASAAAQRQAVADVLFEAAAGESAVGETETVLEDPSWLDDAAAYDAAVAEMDEDGLSALDILSDDDTSPVHALRSQARLNLSSLEHLLLSDSEEDAEEGEDNSSAAGIPSASDRQSMEAQGLAAQSNSMANVLVLDSAGEDTKAAASATAAAASSSQPASQFTSESAQFADQAGPESPPEMAIGHDGRPRVVMSDLTSRFPTEQQLPQQLPEEGADKAKDSSFQLQRRGRQPRVCRSLLPTSTDTAAEAVAANCSNSQGASTSAGAPDVPMLRPVLRSSARSQAMQSTSQVHEASSAESQTQTTRCTRRQARLNKQSSLSSSQHGPQSHADLSSDDDFAVLSRSQRSNRSAAAAAAAAASQAPPLQSGLTEVHVSNRPTSNVPLAEVSQQAAGTRKNRPRLQLNRNASKKIVEGSANGSEAAAGPTANVSNVS